jgi:PAS domain-containing protein
MKNLMHEHAAKSVVSEAGLKQNGLNQKKAKKPVGNGQKDINKLISSLPTILIGLSKNNTIVLWNSRAEKILGKNQSEVLGLPPDH